MGSLIPFNLVGLPSYRSPESSNWTSETGGGDIPYYGLYGEALKGAPFSGFRYIKR